LFYLLACVVTIVKRGFGGYTPNAKVLMAVVKKRRYGNKVDANTETTSGACINIMDIDINLEPGPGGTDQNVESKTQADSAI